MIPLQDNAPRRCPPLVTWGLMGVNVLIFLLMVQLHPQVLERLVHTLGLVPVRVIHPELVPNLDGGGLGYWAFLTCMFVHGGWLHILLNMWTLWIFGDNVEDQMGPGRYLAFYLLTGTVASALHLAANPMSTVPIVGASGAISGVMGAYFAMFPRARIVILVPVFVLPFFFEVPAVFFLAFWFLEQLLSGAVALAGPQFGGGIAWWAHVGGFVCGLLLHRLFVQRNSPRPCRGYGDELRQWGLLEPRDRV